MAQSGLTVCYSSAFGGILLQKSFCTGDQKFSGL